ncbi:hypothetical protein SPBR_02679 [Sporothrix brasiliensis 5110]|uniref:Major facilitator superfamily (MFS) profile domain-containing protein n=1 Tax=Sporothrix brasiliensis 5110 TaxID=1398154 RepID=A0A0C2J2H9_9PEZI|nr:uncharacterized protein SPBR_02679 [Sporothrix brasiliensis 5110]KIH93245.1 hypothetical protein SPBR_02679 [Sporothrix brasiliensis 5110]
MPFGIWDPESSRDGTTSGSEFKLNGTERLIDEGRVDIAADAAESHFLKRIIHKGEETILVPQPSDDPNDPLLWPRWQKEAAFWTIFFNAIIFAILPGPIIAPATFLLAGVFHVPLTRIAQLSGYQLLVVGAFGPFVSVLAQKYGKRPQFLFAAVSATVGTAICVAGSERVHYQTVLAGRIIQGFGVTAWESLAVAAVGDLFYLHERGLRTAILVVALAGTASIVAIISGAMSEGVGWASLFVALLPIDVVCLLLTVFLLPETQFARKTQSTAVLSDNVAEKPGLVVHAEMVHTNTSAQSASSPTHARKSFGQRLRPFSDRPFTQESVFHLLLAAVAHLGNPAVWWILLVSGVLVCFFVVTAYILSQIFSVPPYNLGVAANGFFYVGPFIGGLAAVSIGPLCDWTARFLARRHNGIFEAEFRIPVNILGLLCCGLGWFLFAWRVDHEVANGYYLASFCFGLVCFGVSVPSTSAGLYIL